MTRLYPADHPLGSSSLKLERAEVHLTDLIAQVNEALAPDTVASTSEPERNLFPTGIPDEWSALIGDFVSNLSHSLDHLAWALASKQREKMGEMIIPKGAARRIVFPLHESSESYPPDWIDRLWHPAHTVIESFQPYHRSDRPELELLGILRELSNRDKHRVVTATDEARTITLPSGKEFTATFDHKNTPTSLVSVQIYSFGGDGSDDDLEPQTTSDIVVRSFEYRHGSTVSVTEEFPKVHDLIRDEVIPAFADFFE